MTATAATAAVMRRGMRTRRIVTSVKWPWPRGKADRSRDQHLQPNRLFGRLRER